MKLSTMTNIHMVFRNDPDYFSTVDCIQACSKAGFKILDLSLSGITQPGRYLSDDSDHEAYVAKVMDALNAEGVRFAQSHTVFYGTKYPLNSPEFKEFTTKAHSNLRLSARFNIPWTVLHPLQNEGIDKNDREQIMQVNADFFKSLIPTIDETGVGIAIENMIGGQFIDAKSLLELLDRIDGGDRFGLCWDTGHAHLSKQDQISSIHAMGNRLKTTHIADNRGLVDDHLYPFSGTIEWEPIVKALNTSGYEGVFSFEVHNATMNHPVELRDTILRNGFEIGSYLINV